MRAITIILFLLLFSETAFGANEARFPKGAIVTGGGLGVGGAPASNLALDVQSTTKAFSPPRMTTAQRDAIASPTAGMLIYNTTTSQLNQYSGATWGAVAGSGGGGIYQASQNLITNYSWETNDTGWTASGGTYARTTDVAHIVPPGVGAASWDPAASGNTLTATAITITANDGLSGRNGVVSCSVKTAATDLKMQAYDGTNVLTPNATTDVVPSSSAGFARYSLNFTFPASGTITLRFYAQSDSAIAYVDDCYLGLAEGFNVGTIVPITNWQSYTPTLTGITIGNGTVAGKSRRVGDSEEIEISVQSGSSTTFSGTYTFSIPHTVDTSKTVHANQAVGVGWLQVPNGTNYTGATIINGNALSIVGPNVGNTWGSASPVASTNGSGNLFFIRAVVPVSGWSSETGYRPDQTPASWSGSITGTGWNVTSGTYADFATGSGVAVSQAQNTNFGSVSAIAGSLPGITFSNAKPRTFLVCGQPSHTNGGTNNNFVRLVDGSGTQVFAVEQRISTANGIFTNGACGFWSAPSGVVSLKYQGAVAAGTGTLSYGNIQLVSVSDAIPAPLLVGSVTSNSSGQEHIERSKVTTVCTTGTCTVVDQTGSWVSIAYNGAAGTYRATINAGIFSATPSCWLQHRASTGANNGSGMTENSATQVDFNFDNGTTGENSSFNFFCMGPR
jgi:hypothetical protein